MLNYCYNKYMNYKRAAGIALVAYIATFLIGIITTSLAQVPFSTDAELPTIFFVIQIFAMFGIGVLFTIWYLRSPSVKTSGISGLHFGFSMIAVGFVLDAVAFVPALVNGLPITQIISLYVNPLFWIAVLILLATSYLTGFALAKRRAAPRI
jgi:hypothetical protein